MGGNPTPHHYLSHLDGFGMCLKVQEGKFAALRCRWDSDGFPSLRASPWEIVARFLLFPLLGVNVFGNDFIRLVTYGTKESVLRNWKLESDFRCLMSIGSIFVVPILFQDVCVGDNSTNMEEKCKAEGISRWKQNGIILKLLILWRVSSQPSKINHHIPLDHLAMYQESHPWSFNHKQNWAAHRQGYSVTSLHTGNGWVQQR